MITNPVKWGTYTVTKNYRIDEQGNWFKIIEESVPFHPGDILETLVKDMGFLAPMLAPATWSYFKKDAVLVIRRLFEIPFKIPAVAQVDASVVPAKVMLTPAFGQMTNGILVEPCFTYKVPANQRLWLCLAYGNLMDMPTPYLIAQHTETGALYHPILPNVYNTGKVCLGAVPADNMRYNPKKGLEAVMSDTLAAWSNSTWNEDLAFSNHSQPDKWFKFDEITKQHIPQAGGWTNYCGPAIAPSSLVIDGLTKAHQMESGVF